MFNEVIRILLRIKLVIKYPLILALITSIIIIASNFIWINNFNHLHIELSPTFAHSPKIDQKSQKQLSKKQHTALSNDASSLTQQGHEKLARGESEDALHMWRDAEKLYRQSGYAIGVIGSQINQSIALQELGNYRSSCKTLVLAFHSNTKICNPSNQLENLDKLDKSNKELDDVIKSIKNCKNKSIKIIGLQSLGDILRMVGNLEQSEYVLNKALKTAQYFNLSSSISDIKLSLGKTQEIFFYKQKNLYNLIAASGNYGKKLKAAENVSKAANKANETFKNNINDSSYEVNIIKTRINELRLLVDYEALLKSKSNEWPDGDKYKFDVEGDKTNLVSQLIENEPNFSIFSPIQEIYARLNLVNILILIKEIEKNDSIKEVEVAKKYAQSALDKAYELHNERAEAYALGVLGSIYFHDNQLNLSKKYTEKASVIAQSIVVPDITYQLLQQLGKIYEKLNDSEQAIIAYDAAIKNLDIVRSDLLSLSPDIRFSFQDNIFPVYQELIEILLNEPDDSKKLNKVFEVNSSLQEAELQSFIQCNTIYFAEPEKLNLNNSSLKNIAAIIHLIRLNNQLLMIAKFPENSNKPILIKKCKLEVDEFNKKLNELYSTIDDKDNFQKGKDEEQFKKDSHELYKLLFSNLEENFPDKGTLIFTLDSYLKNIPISTLYDGKQYLVQKYSIVMTLGGKIPESKPLSKNNLRVLFSGLITDEHRSFKDAYKKLKLRWKALCYVKKELEHIKEYTNDVAELLEKKFTQKNFKNKLLFSDFPIFHVATHGHFSSNPEDTFIAASDKLIKLQEIQRLLQVKNNETYNSINLLVLSACETAKSDRIGSLGMAGIAIQAGAKSTLATLWKVQDYRTAELIGEFYKALSEEKLNKAESLRKAQLSLINNQEYNHPYYWGAFVLAGNWL